MRWPWQRKAEPQRETRQSTQPFTDAIVAAIAEQAGGTALSDPLGLAALEMAAGAYARALAGATLTPAVPALTPAVRASIGRSLIRRGESVHLIEVERGMVKLYPAGSWDVRGSWDPATWFYRADLFGPSGNITRLVPGAAVVHCKYAFDPARPWHGLSPLAWAATTGNLAAALELRLSQEAGGPVGHVIPVPQDPEKSDSEDDEAADPSPLDDLRADLLRLKGRTALVETTFGGWGEGQEARPQTDWQARRFGASPPETLAVLRSDAGKAVLGACGCPVSLFIPEGGSGQTERESFRRFILASVEPLAELAAVELADKLDVPGLRFDFKALLRSDLETRARSFKQLTGGGMETARAVELAGLA